MRIDMNKLNEVISVECEVAIYFADTYVSIEAKNEHFQTLFVPIQNDDNVCFRVIHSTEVLHTNLTNISVNDFRKWQILILELSKFLRSENQLA